MIQPRPPAGDSSFRHHVNESIADHRARLALAEEERSHRRRLDLEEQRSQLNPPAVRVRAWEKLHGLRLPSDALHPVLRVIAIDTGLTLAEVQAEQQARGAGLAPPQGHGA